MGRPEPWNLWHLAVVVLVVALLLGGLVALKKEAEGSGLGGWPVVSGVIGIFAVTSFGLARIGTRLTRRPLSNLRSWGISRGGIDGFLAWVFSSFADAAILVGSIATGLAAASGLGWLILTR